jgi:uncharacterized protein (TIGR02271 family)
MNDPRTAQDPASLGATLAGTPDEHGTPLREGSTVTLPIVTESIEVEKVDVDRGGCRVARRVGSRGVVVDELLQHETVRIERRPVNRELADGEVLAVRFEGDTMIVPVVKEVVVTQKRLVLVEEIRIARTSGTHRVPQSATVLEEQIEVERVGAEASVIRSS